MMVMSFLVVMCGIFVTETVALSLRRDHRQRALGVFESFDEAAVPEEWDNWKKCTEFKKLGHGKMGAVYAGTKDCDPSTASRVIKVVKIADSNQDNHLAPTLDKVKREFENGKKAGDHAIGPKVYAGVQKGKFFYIEMDKLEGQTLLNLWNSKFLTYQQQVAALANSGETECKGKSQQIDDKFNAMISNQKIIQAFQMAQLAITTNQDADKTCHCFVEIVKRTLSDFLPQEGKKQSKLALSLQDQIIKLHSLKIKHGDLHPDNVWVNKGNGPDVLIIDYGLSSALVENADDVEEKGGLDKTRYLAAGLPLEAGDLSLTVVKERKERSPGTQEIQGTGSSQGGTGSSHASKQGTGSSQNGTGSSQGTKSSKKI